MKKRKFWIHKCIFLYAVLLISVLSCFSAYANVRIMSYNIKDFWLRFDGEPGTIIDEGAKLNQRDFQKLAIVAGIINQKDPDVIGILECASLAELFFLMSDL